MQALTSFQRKHQFEKIVTMTKILFLTRFLEGHVLLNFFFPDRWFLTFIVCYCYKDAFSKFIEFFMERGHR